MMNSAGRFREYAAECVQRATDAPSTDDKNLHLNMALAWVRLAQQSEILDQGLSESDDGAPEMSAPEISLLDADDDDGESDAGERDEADLDDESEASASERESAVAIKN